MINRRIGAIVLGIAAMGAGTPARAQFVTSPATAASWYAAPGNYGMAYGTASFGVPRTYSVYSSPYGAGYGYGYAPSTAMPGRYGVGLWRPGFAAPGYVYGAGSYRTFPVPYRPATGGPIPPPVGAYAPGFGPTPVWGW